MRTFKRPMFRKGGNVGDGIMTGIVDRTQAQDGYTGIENIDIGTPKTQAEYIEEIRAGAGDYGGMDPLTSFLLTAGPSVAGATGFADAVNRLQPATKQLIEGADAKAKYDRDIRMAGTKLALADEQKFDDRRFDLALKADDRSYQDFLREDEREYLAGIKADDRIYNKGLIEDERKFNLDLIKDQRAYEKLRLEDKQAYDAKILAEAREYKKMEKEDQRKYEEKLIKEGRQFELDKIIRAEEFQEKLYDKEQEAAKRYTEKDFIEVYEGDTLQANNRAKFENEKLKTKVLEKFGNQFEGFLNGPNDPQESTLIKKGNNKKVGKVYYDVNTGDFKIYNKKTDGTYGFQLIEDIDTYVKPDAPKGSTQEEKREYDAKILTEAREYNKMEKDEQRKYEERLIKEGRAFELEKIIRAEEFQKDLYNLEKEDAKKYTEKDFLEVYEGDTLQAKNRADFENNKSKTVFIEKFGSNFEGFLNGPNDPQESTMIKKGNNKKVGKVYYDVNTGEAKIYNKKTDGTYGFQIIDIDTYVKPDPPKGSTEAEKDAEISERYEYLSDRQRKILEEIKKNKPDETAA